MILVLSSRLYIGCGLELKEWAPWNTLGVYLHDALTIIEPIIGTTYFQIELRYKIF